MDAWAYYLQQAAAAPRAAATQAAARATAEGEAAMTLLQLSSGSGFRGSATPPAEPQEEPPLPAVAVAESQIIVPQTVHVADSQDAPQAVEHVSSGATAGASLPLIPPGYLCGAAALHKSREDIFGNITGSSSSSSSLAKVAAPSSSPAVRDKQKGKLVVPDAAKNKKRIIKKRRLDDIHAELQAAQAHPPAAPRPRNIPLPLPASSPTFECTRCDEKFYTFQALGGHMAGHKRANKYHVAACDLQRSLLHQGAGGAVPGANAAAASTGSGLGKRIILPPPPPTAPIIKNLIASSRMAYKLRVEARAAIDASAASASAPAAPRGQPKDFDLNEMPTEEE